MDKKYNNEIESINTFNDTRMFQDLFEQSLDGIVLTDDRGIIIDWNKSMERICGIKRSDVIGEQCFDIFQKFMPGSESVHHMINKLLAAKEELLTSGDTRSVNRPIDITISHRMETSGKFSNPLLIKTGKSIKLCGILRDVTGKANREDLREQICDLKNSLKAVART